MSRLAQDAPGCSEVPRRRVNLQNEATGASRRVRRVSTFPKPPARIRPVQIDSALQPKDLTNSLDRLFELARQKVRLIEQNWDVSRGTPVFTVEGKYTSKGWTEWTQGFQYGCAILTFDAIGDRELLELGRKNTLHRMAAHVTHTGVHDHGFNNLSTYGNLRRLMREGKIDHNE